MKTKKLIISVAVIFACALLTINAEAAKEGGKSATKSKTAAKSKTATKSKVSGANVFNRLLKKEKMKNAPPQKDGVHDPANDGTHVLQPPLIAYEGLPKSEFGNFVD